MFSTNSKQCLGTHTFEHVSLHVYLQQTLYSLLLQPLVQREAPLAS
jgi:hypothetical protein